VRVDSLLPVDTSDTGGQAQSCSAHDLLAKNRAS
jgi:hypothetical protein